jgi:uncharacterized membrane protein
MVTQGNWFLVKMKCFVLFQADFFLSHVSLDVLNFYGSDVTKFTIACQLKEVSVEMLLFFSLQ